MDWECVATSALNDDYRKGNPLKGAADHTTSRSTEQQACHAMVRRSEDVSQQIRRMIVDSHGADHQHQEY